MRHVTVARSNTQIARPLKVLVPLIKNELSAGDSAGLEHFRQAGQMLNEAKDQVPYGAWGRWLKKNFELGQTTAWRYMRLASKAAEDDDFESSSRGKSLYDMTGEKRVKTRAAWDPVHEAADRVNVTRLADERQSRDNEIKLHREVALKLIDLGYRALATRLHPDSRDGSRDAMRRLNQVRDELKSIAATRRFV